MHLSFIAAHLGWCRRCKPVKEFYLTFAGPAAAHHSASAFEHIQINDLHGKHNARLQQLMAIQV
eukprot:7457-Heterococcus_DN1.PRE.1